MSIDIDPQDALQLVRTMTQHIDLVQEGMLAIRQDLERREMVHDRSKFSADEFAGFTRINRVAREHPYGSPEYRAGLKAEAETVSLHYKRNSHHPEHHRVLEWAEPHMWKAEQMGFLDIIEMVCDWRSAYLTYGSQGTCEENIERQRERYKDRFSEGQWWLIGQMANFVAGAVK